MKSVTSARKKVTLSLPESLIKYADAKAKRAHESRSQVIASCIEEARAKELEALAARGYQFYAREAEEFAKASIRAVSEAIESGG